MSKTAYTARPHVLHETNLRQLRKFKPKVAVLPWGATEAHNYHLPYGTDVTEATALGEAGVEKANQRGGRCLLLPTIPFGINHTQLYQMATITMRASTQYALLHDVAQSLVIQGIDRLVVLNFHGGNDFKSMIRDVAFDLPIFITQVHGYLVAPEFRAWLKHPDGDHADEFETSLMLHLAPQWVAPLSTAGSGATHVGQAPSLSTSPGVWFPRDWKTFTNDSGAGDPSASNAQLGKRIHDLLSDRLGDILATISKMRKGKYPFTIRGQSPKPQQ